MIFMYEKELISVLNARVKELEKKNAELEEKHWGECRLISLYDEAVRDLRTGYFQLLDENVVLRMWIRDHFNGDISETSKAVDEALAKKIENY